MTDTTELSRSELLIVKVGEDYARFVEDGYERCAMNKASVFPRTDLELLKEKCAICFGDGTEFLLRKLVIIEEPFEG